MFANFSDLNGFNNMFVSSVSGIGNEDREATLGQENLSDCGFQTKILDAFCRVNGDAVRNLERMCFNKEQGGYTWA